MRPSVRARIVCVSCAALLAVPVEAVAQQDATGSDGGLRGHKRFLYALAGAVAAGVPAYLVGGGRSAGGFCSSRTCLTGLGVVMGGGVGFLIGLEHDQKLTRRLQKGPTLQYAHQVIALSVVPEEIVPFRSGAVVTGIGGAELVYADGRTVSRARGIRGIEDAAVMEPQDLVVFATASGLLAFPLSGDTVRGSLLDRTGGSALEAIDADLAVGDASEIRLLRVTAPVGESPSAERVAAVASGGLVVDLRWSPFSRAAWALIEDRLVAYAPGSLDRLGELTLPAPGLTMRIRGDRAVIAAGSGGVILVDIADPTAPRVVQVIRGIRFAYSADLYADRLHVAAGPEGLVVIDVSDESAPQVLGVARSARFVRDVLAEEGKVWVLDRDGRRVEIAEITAAETAAR